MSEQKYKKGDAVSFTGYAEEPEDGAVLTKGDKLTVVKFVAGDEENDDAYVVKNANGDTEEVFVDEIKAAPAASKKTAKKKTAAKKAATKKAATKKTAKKKTATKKAAAKKTATKKTAAKKTAKKKAATRKPEKVGPTEQELLDKLKVGTATQHVLDSHKGNPVTAMKAVVKEQRTNDIVLGGLLSLVKKDNLQTRYKDAETGKNYTNDKDGFDSFIKETLGWEGRKSQYLIDIYLKIVSRHKVPESSIADLGWTKGRELLPLADNFKSKDDVKDWIDKAKDESVTELRDSVREELVNTGSKTHKNKDLDKKVTRRTVLFNDQAKIVDEAFAKAKKELAAQNESGDDVSDGMALAHICTQWLNG